MEEWLEKYKLKEGEVYCLRGRARTLCKYILEIPEEKAERIVKEEQKKGYKITKEDLYLECSNGICKEEQTLDSGDWTFENVTKAGISDNDTFLIGKNIIVKSGGLKITEAKNVTLHYSER